MKLNLGSGHFGDPSDQGRWVNVDIAHEDKPDVCGDARTLPFATATFEQILASHVLEHMHKWDGLKMLAECRRVLQPGGVFEVRVPDTLAVMKCYVMQVDPPKDNGLLRCTDTDGKPASWTPRDLDWCCHLFFYSSAQRSPHLWSYDQQTLLRALVQAGFEWVRAVPRRDWWEVCLEAWQPDGGETPAGFERVKLRQAA